MVHFYIFLWISHPMAVPEPVLVRTFQLFVGVVIHAAKVCKCNKGENDIFVVCYEDGHLSEDQNECYFGRLHHQCIVIIVFIQALVLLTPILCNVSAIRLISFGTNGCQSHEKYVEHLISDPSVHGWEGAMDWDKVKHVYKVTSVIFVLRSPVYEEMQNA